MTAGNDVGSAVESAIGDGGLIVVSNRQPYSHGYGAGGDEDGTGDENGSERTITVDRPAGGLTAGLDPVLQRTAGTWIAWGDGEADREVTNEDGEVRMPPESEAYTLKRVWLDEETVEEYYYGYSNRVLWPLCHGGVWKTEFAERHWQRYRQVNETFAESVVERAEPDSLIWFQDYHFSLAPRFVREAASGPFLMHFWHITWPAWDTFRACPQHRALLAGLLGNDLLGFHTERYCANFLDCVANAFEDAFVDREDGRVNYEGHTTTVQAFPLGVDAAAIAESSTAVDPDFFEGFGREHGIAPGTRIALGVDRLDYTKGIVERLNALERLFETHEDWRGRLTYVQKASESRSLIPEYQDLQTEVRESIERLDERFGTEEWTPVIYLDQFLPSEELYGLYRAADVMLVSAVRDGMNLVAKEFVAAQVDEPGDPPDERDREQGAEHEGIERGVGREPPGVLVLSDQTGAYEELGEHALTINPYDTEGFADAIAAALSMPADERRERMATLREQVTTNDLDAWMARVFGAADELRATRERNTTDGA
jgi:trehalose 6-phosphate synthase